MPKRMEAKEEIKGTASQWRELTGVMSEKKGRETKRSSNWSLISNSVHILINELKKKGEKKINLKS